MLQPAQNLANSQKTPLNPSPYTPPKTISAPMEQATIGRTLVIKGEVTGSEPLYIDGRIEGSITLADNRVTIGRNGSVTANINAREVVIMGNVKGNIQCTDRLDIRSEGSLAGDVVTQRISVEDGAMVKGSVEVRHVAQKNDAQKNEKTHGQSKASESVKPASTEQPKAAAAAASTGTSVSLLPGSKIVYEESH